MAAVGLTVVLADPVLAQPVTPTDSGLRDWINRFWPEASSAGISRETYRRAFQDIALDPGVLEAANRQAEFVKPVWAYLDSAVSDARIASGRRYRSDLSEWLSLIERQFGVESEVVLAIWGMESSYGAILNNPKVVRSTIGSLATLALADPKRARFARQQLLAALQILQSGDVAPERMTGSWAGAMGHTQFIPTTYLAHAVDFDGDGRRDIWNSVPDALASTANYLRASGWRRGQTWGYEVALPPGFDFALHDETRERAIEEWERLGVRRVLGRTFPRTGEQATLFLPAGALGPAFLILPNFKAILRYNNATSYALAVGHLADRIAGGGPLVTAWRRDEKPLGSEERKELQSRLSDLGHQLGDADGRIGPKTRAAIRSYQQSVGLIPDGHPSSEILDRLRSIR